MSDAGTGRTRAVIVCDRDGNPIRTGNLLEVHQGTGVLHKAFSVFVFRKAGTELLIQQRSRHKRLFPLRWANTCCSHASPAGRRRLAKAARRRLQEELGFSVALREAGAFVYRAKDPDSELVEYEHDTVLIGAARDGISVKPDPAEVADWRWMSVSHLQRDLRDDSAKYAPWLPKALRLALAELRSAS
jgi:isopentenyl-diphosphate delta-isomerase